MRSRTSGNACDEDGVVSFLVVALVLGVIVTAIVIVTSKDLPSGGVAVTKRHALPGARSHPKEEAGEKVTLDLLC
jgi:hypothetical protein